MSSMLRKYKWFTLSLLLFSLSRLFFLNPAGVFFDSDEYLTLFANPSYFQAIVSGHFPPHVGYIILFWPVYHLASLMQLHPGYIVLLGQVVLSTVTIYCFYRVVEFLTDQKTAILASVLASLTPLYWIVTSTIMMENAYITLFFLSLFSLSEFLLQKKPHFLYTSLLFFAFAFVTHMLTLLWLPFLLFLILLKQKNLLLRYIVLVFFSLVIVSVLKVLFLSYVSTEPISAVFHHLYLTKSAEFSVITYSPLGLLITLRNFLIPLLRNDTTILVIAAFISLPVLYRKNRAYVLLCLLWIGPAFFANQWWDSLLPGRHALIASFGLAFTAALMLKDRIFLTSLVVSIMLMTIIPAVSLLNGDIPYIEEANAVRALPKDSLLIETHFAKPQVESVFPGKLAAVNDPIWSQEMIEKEIQAHLSQNKPVFISSGALSDPYGLYSGPYLHNLTLSYAKRFSLEGLMKSYTVEPYKVIHAEDNLYLYRITSTTPSAYPQVKSLKHSYRRLDYADPFTRVWFSLTDKYSTGNASRNF
jgi:hypothetical protein